MRRPADLVPFNTSVQVLMSTPCCSISSEVNGYDREKEMVQHKMEDSFYLLSSCLYCDYDNRSVYHEPVGGLL